MSCSPEETFLASGLGNLGQNVLHSHRNGGGMVSSGSRVQPRGKGKQGSSLETPRECPH